MNLADKTILNVLARSSEAILLLISGMVLVRYFSKSEYGTYLQIMLLTTTITMFASIGFPQSIYYFYHRVTNRQGFIIQNLLLSIGISSVIAIGAYFLKDYCVQWFNNPDLASYWPFVILFILLRGPFSFREPILIASGSLILNSITTVFWSVTFFAPMILLPVLHVPLRGVLIGIVIMSGVQFVAYVGLLLWVIAQLANSSPINASTPPATSDGKQLATGLKAQFLYSAPIGISSYLGIIGKQLDQYLISFFFMPRDYAVYSRGAFEVPMLSTLQFTISDMMMAEFVKSYQAGDIQTFLRYFHICVEKLSKITYPVFALLFATAPSLITFLYTTEYLEAATIFRVYLVLLLLRVTTYAIVLRASGKTSYIINASVLSLLVNAGLSVLLIKVIGPVGAAVATVMSVAITAWYYLWISSKILGVSSKQLLDWKPLTKLFVVCVAASLPVYLLEWLYNPDGLKLLFLLWVEGCIYLYCLAFLMIKTNLIFPEDFATLRKWLKFDVEGLLRTITFSA